MNYRDILRTANANLRKSKLRTFLTISAVFMGAFTLMLTTGVGAGLKGYVEEQVGAVGAKDVLVIAARVEGGGPIASEPKEYDPERKSTVANSMGQGPALTKADLEKISKTSGIKNVEPLYSLAPEYITAGQAKYTASLSQTVEGLNQPLKSGRLVNQQNQGHEITIPPSLVGSLGLNTPEDAVNRTVTIAFKDATGAPFTLDARIVGVQEKTLINGNDVTANLSLVKKAFERATTGVPAFQKDRYGAAFAKFDTSLSPEQLAQLKNTLKDQGYDARTLDDQLGVIKNVINGITTFLNIFAGIALAAASFGIVNTLFMAVQERTREIGLMKALGMRRSRIFMLFSLEAMLIGFWGALVALGAANIVGRIGSQVATRTLFKDFDGLQLFSFPALSMLPIIALIMAIAFLAATLPARRAARLDPIDALRYE